MLLYNIWWRQPFLVEACFITSHQPTIHTEPTLIPFSPIQAVSHSRVPVIPVCFYSPRGCEHCFWTLQFLWGSEPKEWIKRSQAAVRATAQLCKDNPTVTSSPTAKSVISRNVLFLVLKCRSCSLHLLQNVQTMLNYNTGIHHSKEGGRTESKVYFGMKGAAANFASSGILPWQQGSHTGE